MFRINIPVLKAFEKNGKTYIRGVASDSSLDLHEERMSDECLKNFEESVNKGDIPLRADHSLSWRQVLGRLTKACLGKSGSKPLEVEAMVDENMSGGKDLVAALNSGAVLGLSVAGRVKKMSYEWSDSLKKQVRVYEDIILEEISVVSTPANPRTSVSIAKSLDTKPGESVGKAEVMDSKAGMSVREGKVPSRILTELIVSKNKSVEEILNAVKKSEPLSKIDHSPSYSDDPHGVSIVSNGDNSGSDFITTDGDSKTEMAAEVEMELSSEDFLRLLYIMRVLNDVGPMEPVEPPDKLFDWNYQQTLREECFVMMDDGISLMPHHNPDYTLDAELVKFYMAALVNGQAWSVMCCIEDYCTALSHIYYHFKELSMPKLEAKSLKLKKDAVVEPEITEEVVEPTPVETEPVVAEVVAEVAPEAEVKEEEVEAVAEVVEGGTPEVAEVVAEEIPAQAEEVVDGEVVEKALTLKDLLPILKEIKGEIDALKVAKSSTVEVAVADAPVVVKSLEEANESIESLKKELTDTKELATKAFQLVEKIASQPRGRQSVAYSTVAKSESQEAASETSPTEQMALLMKEKGMSFTQAYQLVSGLKQ